MSLITVFFIYFVVFWTVIFCVLTWGNRAEETPQSGHAPSAPANPRIARKFLITAILSALITLMIYILVKADIVDFRDLARDMHKEDMEK